MIISHRKRLEALAAGMQSMGARIAVTVESDHSVTVFVEPDLGVGQIYSYASWDEAMVAWEGKVATARESRRAIRFVDGLFDPKRSAEVALRVHESVRVRLEELSRCPVPPPQPT